MVKKTIIEVGVFSSAALEQINWAAQSVALSEGGATGHITHGFSRQSRRSKECELETELVVCQLPVKKK